jgi:hypothetical protein
LWQQLRKEETKSFATAEEDYGLEDKFYVLVECADEQEQVELLERFTAEGLRCQAKLA